MEVEPNISRSVDADADADMNSDPSPSAASATHQGDDLRRFVCHCGKQFVRKGHLARHMATHSAPTFKCDVCGASFTRRKQPLDCAVASDLLQRHAGSHTSEMASRRSACDFCHSRKRKCEPGVDGAPCNHCRSAGVACTYPGQSQRDAETRMSIIGLTAMLEIIKATPPTIPLKHNMDDSPEEIRAWYGTCVDSYIREWHAKWPIVTLFSVQHHPFPIWAPIILTACWSLNHSSLRYLILEIHSHLMDRSFEIMLRGGSSSGPGEAWQVEVYEAALLLIILAFHIADDIILYRTDLLLSCLVTVMRQIGMFDSSVAKRQKETHFPGSFPPYVVGWREQRSRLVAGLFKIDTYLSLRRHRPPLLQAEELDVNLPCTLALGHAHPIPRFFARQLEEPPHRKDRTILELCSIPRLASPAVLLVEDVVLGLCGLWPSIWRFTRTARLRRPSESGRDFISLADRLGEWQTRLEQISSLISRPDPFSSEPGRLFLQAYRGLEDEDSQQGKDAAVQRVKALLEEGLDLLKALRSALIGTSFSSGSSEGR